MAPGTLTATYTSQSAAQTFSTSLPALPGDSKTQDIKEKTAYLSALRSGAALIQNDVNAYLTQKMDEERATENGKADGKGKAEDEKEEEMYGEEDPGEDS